MTRSPAPTTVFSIVDILGTITMSGPDQNELVRVMTVTTPVDAEIARLALEAEGIMCEISGESQAGLAGVLPIKLYVRLADCDRAREITEQTSRTDAGHQ